jgi:deferrochelatase/peroxidase EfeB
MKDMGEDKIPGKRTDKSKDSEREPRHGLLQKPMARRDVLRMAGYGGLGLLLGAGSVGGTLAARGAMTGNGAVWTAGAKPEGQDAAVPFYGKHQAGITTPAQDFLYFAAFDLTTTSVADVRDLFRKWTEAAAKMSLGQPVDKESGNAFLPPADTGEAAGLSASRTTITFGAGPGLFDSRFGLADKRPAALADLPAFAGEELRPEWCGGDLGVQVCADDLQVAFHAVRNLARMARGVAVLRWTQEGFQRTSQADPSHSTPRNIMGFKDGTLNPDTKDEAAMNQILWAQQSDGQPWMQGGSYMVVRRIRMRIEIWDRSSLQDQEATFGRHRDSGAPLGAKNEFDPVDLNRKDAEGKPLIPDNAHIRLARGDSGEKILRRSYTYSGGMDLKTGQLDAGLFFVCFQRDLRRQFIPIQQRLAAKDALNEYIVHTGSACFACFPGTERGGYIGETLFKA